jgi:hypothetical protein
LKSLYNKINYYVNFIVIYTLWRYPHAKKPNILCLSYFCKILTSITWSWGIILDKRLWVRSNNFNINVTLIQSWMSIQWGFILFNIHKVHDVMFKDQFLSIIIIVVQMDENLFKWVENYSNGINFFTRMNLSIIFMHS